MELIVKNGMVGTATGVQRADVGVCGGPAAAMGESLTAGGGTWAIAAAGRGRFPAGTGFEG